MCIRVQTRAVSSIYTQVQCFTDDKRGLASKVSFLVGYAHLSQQ